jgi:hypothetical protein
MIMLIWRFVLNSFRRSNLYTCLCLYKRWRLLSAELEKTAYHGWLRMHGANHVSVRCWSPPQVRSFARSQWQQTLWKEALTFTLFLYYRLKGMRCNMYEVFENFLHTLSTEVFPLPDSRPNSSPLIVLSQV